MTGNALPPTTPATGRAPRVLFVCTDAQGPAIFAFPRVRAAS